VHGPLKLIHLSRSGPVWSRVVCSFTSQVLNSTEHIVMTQSYDWLFEEIERQKATLADARCEMLSHQKKAFQTWRDLLQEDEESLNKRSKQRRSERIRARDLLVDIHSIIGPEAFLLCAIATSISKWVTISPEIIIPKLRTWWETALHPEGLTTIATSLCSSIHILRNTNTETNAIKDFGKLTLRDSIILTFCQRNRSTLRPS
jgi:hypothetical protein